MHEQLIADLKALKTNIENANNAVGMATIAVMNAKKALQDKEDALLMGKIDGIVIDGKNAEARSAQIREQTVVERDRVMHTECALEGAKATLGNRRAELQINLALVELVKGVA